MTRGVEGIWYCEVMLPDRPDAVQEVLWQASDKILAYSAQLTRQWRARRVAESDMRVAARYSRSRPLPNRRAEQCSQR